MNLRTNRWRRLVLIGSLGALIGIFVIPLNPVSSTILKLAFLGSIVGAWLGVTILSWRRNMLRWIVLIVPFLALIPWILPGREIDANELRNDYVQRMIEFKGTTYYWGGESARGIDCSGLPRRALRDSLFAYGVRHANGRAFRIYAEQWWFDASAKALGEGYRNYTNPVGIEGTIQEMSYKDLLPGDLAVSTNGLHVLAYLGNDRWIQASPGIGSVVILHGRKDQNGWFCAPVTTHRWQILE